MRSLTADLAAVHKFRSPSYRVAVTVEARGQNPDAPAVAWSELIATTGAPSHHSAGVGLADGSIIRFKSDTTTIKQQTVSDPTSAASWTDSAWADIVTGVIGTLAPIAALRISDTIRLFYLDIGNVRYKESTDNGTSWGAEQTVYAGGDANADLAVGYIADNDYGPWFIAFSTLNAGTYAPRFAYLDGTWKYPAYNDDWRAAGIMAYAADTTSIPALVFKAADTGPSRFRSLSWDGSYSSNDEIDHTQGGLFGLRLSWYKMVQLPTAACMLGPSCESADGSGAYEAVAGVFESTDICADEPISLPDIHATTNHAYTYIAESAAGDLYYFGTEGVYRGTKQAATSRTLTPIRYTYFDHNIEIIFQAGIPDIYVGQILVVTRTMSWRDQTGSESLRFYVTQVEKGNDLVRIRAADPIGFLGIMRCRRPSILNDGGAAGLGPVMRRLCARHGIACNSDETGLDTDTVMPLTIQPAESLLGAAYRAGSQADAYLVPKNDGTFAATLINPPTSDSGDYDDTAHVYPNGEQLLIRSYDISDYNHLAFAYILGTQSTDPEDGAAIAMAMGPLIPNTRPISFSLTNTRYNTAARVQAAATAEANRQKKLTIDGRVEAPANLALELYDMITVTDSDLSWSAKPFRVRRLREKWEHYTLLHTLYLGDEA